MRMREITVVRQHDKTDNPPIHVEILSKLFYNSTLHTLLGGGAIP